MNHLKVIQLVVPKFAGTAQILLQSDRTEHYVTAEEFMCASLA